MNICNPESISSIASHSHSGTIKLWRQRQDQWGERNIEKVQNKDQEGGFSHDLGVLPPASDTGLKQTGFGKSLWVSPARLSLEASSLSSMVRIRFWKQPSVCISKTVYTRDVYNIEDSEENLLYGGFCPPISRKQSTGSYTWLTSQKLYTKGKLHLLVNLLKSTFVRDVSYRLIWL